jgi:hypothetical protein
MSDPDPNKIPSIASLSDWDGRSDVILIACSESGATEVRICPADVMHRALNQYREFIATHQLVMHTEWVDDQMVVFMHFEAKGE